MLKNEKGEIKGVSLIIVNTGGEATFQEILCDISFAANRLHQLKTGEIECHKGSCPRSEETKQASRTLAADVQIGRLLIKQEIKLSQERSVLAQNAAYTTARNLTANNEQEKS